MRRLILGTAGHIDHGKTALVRALTGVDTDRLPEEKRRGITIDLGFARLLLADDIDVGIVDVPGHEGFIRNMLAGATGIDVALLVVAADEGVMPQTREHYAILELLRVDSLVVALTKMDLVETEWLDLVAEDVRDLLRGGPFADAPLISVSARTGEGLDRLQDALSLKARSLADRNDRDLFRLPIDRVFTVRGTGTVVTGTVWSGTARVDDQVRLLPGDSAVRIRAIQVHGEEAAEARAGQRAALALAGTPRSDLTRGDALVRGSAWAESPIVTARVRVLAGSPPLRHGQRIRFHLGTAEVLGRIACLEQPDIQPGQIAWAQIRLEKAVVARVGDPFVIRSYSPVSTVAGGIIAEAAAPKRKRSDASLRAALDAVLRGDDTAGLEAATRLAGWAGLPIDRVPVATRIPADRVDSVVRISTAHGGTRVVGGTLFDKAILDDAEQLILSAVNQHHQENPLHPGLSRELIRRSLPTHTRPDLADHVMLQLVADQRLEMEASAVRRAGFQPELSPEQRRTADLLLGAIEAAGLAPPTAEELPASIGAPSDIVDLLHFLVRTGSLVTLPGARFIARNVLEQAIGRAASEFAGRDDLSPADFRELFGTSRKYLIPLLEHFDRTGVTVRSGELRRLPRLAEQPDLTATSP